MEMTEEDRDAVNTRFNTKLAELVVARSKRDNNVDVKNAPANLDDSESLGGYDSFSAEDEGGEEEEIVVLGNIKKRAASGVLTAP